MRRLEFKGPKRSSGVALITILLIVVIATVLGVAMTTDQHFAINRAQTFSDQSMVRQYALGGEELARQLLHQDFIDSPETDHLGEAWAANDLRFEFEEGEIELKIEDLQGRINVNSLLMDDARTAKSRMTAMFSEQGIDPVFVDRIQDWVDDNSSVDGFGAEDFDYLGLERPYRAANQKMLDTSELRLILEMEDELYQQLAPYLSALPDVNAEINVNTAPPRVLIAAAPGLALASAEGVAANRDTQGAFNTVDEFFDAADITATNQESLSVQSSFFQVSVRARVQDRFGYLTSVIQRDRTDGTLRVIYRDLSKKIQPFIVDAEVSAQDG